jgi:aspartate carbamoyltransferase catalytic subunit
VSAVDELVAVGYRLISIGADVVGVTEARSSSMAKGETLADTARIISSYVDLMVARHPLEGSACVLPWEAPIPSRSLTASEMR